MIPVLLGQSGLILGSSSQQYNLLGRTVSGNQLMQLVKYGTVGGGIATAFAAGGGYLAGLAWSLGMGQGALATSPRVQEENAKAYQRGLMSVEEEKAFLEAEIERRVASYYRDYDRAQYEDYEAFKARVELETNPQTANVASRDYEFTL
jgi:hypothetical protein